MNAHTPGPWAVVDGHYPSFKNISGPSFKVSAIMWATDLTESDYEKRDADLHLIAAAPDLLEALEYAVARYGKPGGPWNVPSDPGGWLDTARSAIAKATGSAA